MKSTTATAVKNRLNNIFAVFGYLSKYGVTMVHHSKADSFVHT